MVKGDQLGLQEAPAAPDDPDEAGAGDQRRAEEPVVEGSSEDVGRTASGRFECGQQSRHPGSGLRELLQLRRDGHERVRHSARLLRPRSNHAQPRVDGRKLGVQGGEDGKGGAVDDIGGKGPPRLEKHVE